MRQASPITPTIITNSRVGALITGNINMVTADVRLLVPSAYLNPSNRSRLTALMGWMCPEYISRSGRRSYYEVCALTTKK